MYYSIYIFKCMTEIVQYIRLSVKILPGHGSQNCYLYNKNELYAIYLI